MTSNRSQGRDGDSPWARWAPAVTVGVAILIASVVPIPGGSSFIEPDGLLFVPIGLTDPFHFIGYAVLAISLSRGTGRSKRGLVVAAAVSTTFGFGVELVQSAIPWRTFAWRDVAVNAIGAVVGTCVVWVNGGGLASES